MDKDKLKSAKVIPIDTKPTRKLATVFIRTDLWELVGNWADKSGYSRGQVLEQLISKAVEEQEIQAA